MPIVLGILFIIGVVFGTQMEWPWQVAAIFVGYGYLNSRYVASKEIGGILDMLFVAAFMVGMIVGDISWVIQTSAWENWDFGNPFIVK